MSKVNTVNGNTQKIHWEKFSLQLLAVSLGWTILNTQFEMDPMVADAKNEWCGIAWTLKQVWLETERWNELLLWFTGKPGSWTLEFGGGICCRSESDICRWEAREADLYKLKLCKFLWPFNCVRKFSGMPASSKREMLVFHTEWLESFRP